MSWSEMIRRPNSARKLILFLVLLIALFTMQIVLQPEQAIADEKHIVVSFGDSYSSGEGCPPFYGQDSDKKYEQEDWVAHRSQNSWSSKLAFNKTILGNVKCSQAKGEIAGDEATQWYFYACSGAEAHHVYKDEFEKSGVIREPGLSNGKKFSTTVQEQIGEAKSDIGAEALGDVEYVTISIGGNDIGFADIVTEVAVRQGFIDRDYLFNAMNASWYKFDGSVPYANTKDSTLLFVDEASDGPKKRDEIKQCYKSIAETFPNAKILVVGYPTLLNDDEFEQTLQQSEGDFRDKISGWFGFYANNLVKAVGFASWEGWFINQNARDFNRELNTLVLETNRELSNGTNQSAEQRLHFVSVEDYFDGHEAYTDIPFINEVEFLQSEDFEQLKVGSYEPTVGFVANPKHLLSPASSYSMHPNYNNEIVDVVNVNEQAQSGIGAYAKAVQKKINELSEITTTAIPGKIEHYASGEEHRDSNRTATRDIALVLDVSGSMAGDPLDATKNAAGKFVNVALDNGAQTALVVYDDEADVLSEFATGEAHLKAAINKLSDGGGTNMESGLAAAHKLLKREDADDQYIVLMSDGEPNDGKMGDELISYAGQIRDPDGDGKDDVKIYALGFNEGASGQTLMRAIASDGCYISVHDAGDLEDFFQDMVDSINGVKFMYARVACPVDVSVTLNGETLFSGGDNPQTRTSFGSLTFEEDESGQSDDPVKVLRLREGQSYDVSIAGTGQGTMDYSIGFIDDEGIYSDFRTFNGIEITDKTSIKTTAEPSSSTLLSVDEDGDGAVDKTYRAGANEEGELVDNSWIARLVVALFALTVLAVVGIMVWRKLKKHQQRVAHR